MTASAQLALDLAPVVRDACPRCGRPWRGCVDGAGLHLDRLKQLPEADFWAVTTCYLGNCRRGAAA